jgi:hypothetical protein
VARLDAAHARRHQRVGHDVFDLLGRHAVEVHRHRGRQHLDVTDLLGAGVQQHVAVLLRPAAPPGLEQILVHHAHLALGPADRLLEHASEHGVGLVDADGVRELLVMMEHGFGPPAIAE